MILTGTPISNKPPGLWSLLNILRPDLYPSRYEFCQEFTYARYAYGRPVFEGARSLDVLHARLTDHVMVRRRKQDVLDQLPAVTYSVVPLEIDSAEYRRAEADYIGWLEEKSPQMARSAAKAEELTRLHGLKKLAGELKVPSVIDWCRDFFQSSDAKLLLGAIHRAVTAPIVAAFGKRETELVDGRCADVQKNRSFDRFNLDPACRLLVGNVQSAGTGWSCRSTSDLALCEIPWVPGDVAQFVGRVHGLSRGLPGVAAHVRFLVARGTVEEDLCALLDTKQRWSELAIDGRQTDDGPDVYGKIRAAVMDRVRGRSR
jgi:SWI/SNF-related matrix-associated actin-dependent regulator 1 of chromatin subfamily A